MEEKELMAEGIDGSAPSSPLPEALDTFGIHTEYPCDSRCHTKGRGGAIAYLVVHYVGATGSARANAAFFHAPGAKPPLSSAHYFVGHAAEGAAVYRSVPEGDTAWHCGTTGKYRHPQCRNANSLGVELCCRQDKAGRWFFDPETVTAAQALCRTLMARYHIPVSHVVRHFDVTGKNCPAPFVQDASAWAAFLRGL